MISAIIPVWNTPPHELQEALDSLRKTQLASEIILVDDHSDNLQTTQVLQEQSERGCRVITSHHFLSTSGARATGVHQATQPYVLSMDADDTIHGRLQGALAPINLASNNAPKIPLDHPLDYISHPQPLQWGAVIRSDIARHIAFVADDDGRQEDMGWGYRLFLTAWRGKLHIKKSGLSYTWRSPEGRDSVTARYTQTQQQAERMYIKRLRKSLDDLEFVESEQIWNWANRRFYKDPLAECVQSHPDAQVDIHVLSYSESWSSLQKTLNSLKSLPCNVWLVMGGFPGSIGAARAFAFTLGSAEYVSFIDDDDEVIPEAFYECLEAIEASKQVVGVYTDTTHVHLSGRADVEKKGNPWNPVEQLLKASEITHLKIMRRCHVEPYLNDLAQWPTYEEYVLCGLMTKRGPWLHLPIAGAYKRYKPANASSMRLATRELWKKAVARVTPTLMQARKFA